MKNLATENVADLESIETREWLESLDYVLQSNGPARAGQLLQDLAAHARRRGIRLPFSANTPYVNTITPDQESPFPGSQELERKIILNVLEANHWNRKRTASELRISYRALLYKIRQAGLPPKRSTRPAAIHPSTDPIRGTD